MNYLNYLNRPSKGLPKVTKDNVDRLINLLDPTSGISVTRNIYPKLNGKRIINPKSHVTYEYILETINRDDELSKHNTKDRKYLTRWVENVYGCFIDINGKKATSMEEEDE